MDFSGTPSKGKVQIRFQIPRRGDLPCDLLRAPQCCPPPALAAGLAWHGAARSPLAWGRYVRPTSSRGGCWHEGLQLGSSPGFARARGASPRQGRPVRTPFDTARELNDSSVTNINSQRIFPEFTPGKVAAAQADISAFFLFFFSFTNFE